MVGSSTPGAILPTYMLVLFGGSAMLAPTQGEGLSFTCCSQMRLCMQHCKLR